MKFFKLVIAALLFGSLNFAAHASSLKQGDLKFAFGSDSVKTIGLGKDPSIIQFAALSDEEMMETEGDWFNFRFLGPSRSGRVCGFICGGFGFRIDNHANPSPTNLHIHAGRLSSGRSWGGHRPWYAPWRTY